MEHDMAGDVLAMGTGDAAAGRASYAEPSS